MRSGNEKDAYTQGKEGGSLSPYASREEVAAYELGASVRSGVSFESEAIREGYQDPNTENQVTQQQYPEYKSGKLGAAAAEKVVEPLLKFMGANNWQGKVAGGFIALELASIALFIVLDTKHLAFEKINSFIGSILKLKPNGSETFLVSFLVVVLGVLIFFIGHRFKFVRFPMVIALPAFWLFGTNIIGLNFELFPLAKDMMPVVIAIVSCFIHILFLFGFPKKVETNTPNLTNE